MSPDNPNSRTAGSHSGRFLALFIGLLLLFGAAVLGITSYFRLGADARALRDSVFATLKTEPDNTIDLNIGWFTVTAVRTGASLFTLPHEARVALGSLKGVEGGRYVLSHREVLSPGSILESADKAMSARGWTRTVTVKQRPTLLVVYVSDKAAAREKLDCCVLVVHERELIVASARADLKPLVELAFEHVPHWAPELAAK